MRTGRTVAGPPRWKNTALIPDSGFARTAEAQQRAETDEYQCHAARFRNDGSTVDFVRIPAASRNSSYAGIDRGVRIQPEGCDGICGKIRPNDTAERPRTAG